MSICGSGEEGIGGESASEAWPRDILDMTGDVGDEIVGRGDGDELLDGVLGDLGDKGADLGDDSGADRGDVDPSGATTLFCESDNGDGLCTGRGADPGGAVVPVKDDERSDFDRPVNALSDALCARELSPSTLLYDNHRENEL